jgi:hypothetical protein
LKPFFSDEDDVDDNLFDEDSLVGLPRKLSRVIPRNDSTGKSIAQDHISNGLERIEEQSFLNSDAGLQTAKAIQKSRKREKDEQEMDHLISELPDFPLKPRDAQDEQLFKRIDHLKQAGNANELATKLPTFEQTLAYAAQLKSKTHGLWLEASQLHIIQQNKLDGNYQWPKVPLCSRSYLDGFWREPDKSCKQERPCSRVNCESHRLGGFRLRELIYPEEWARVMATKDIPARDGGQWMPELIGWCVMCHLSVTNELYYAAFNRLQEKHSHKDGTEHQQLFRIHHFAVIVDVIGEYKLYQTLAGHTSIMGLFGFFPVYNVHNYIAVKRPGPSGSLVMGWREADTLVFQQAQATSDQIVSSRTTPGEPAKHSTQSGLTGQRPPITGYRP